MIQTLRGSFAAVSKPNTRSKTLDEIYQIHTFLHLIYRKFSSSLLSTFAIISKNSRINMLTFFARLLSNLMNISRIFTDDLEHAELHCDSPKFRQCSLHKSEFSSLENAKKNDPVIHVPSGAPRAAAGRSADLTTCAVSVAAGVPAAPG